MVDMDKHAYRSLAGESYKKKLWPESYITWEFLEAHPRAMEPGYLQINWDTIPRLYNRKQHLRTSVIEKKEWDHLSDPAQLTHFWEPTQNPGLPSYISLGSLLDTISRLSRLPAKERVHHVRCGC